MPSHSQPNSAEFLSSLHDTLTAIFQGAQNSNASHKRRINNLCKLQYEAAQHIQRKDKGRPWRHSIVLVGEKAFNRAFWEVTMCVLEIKRGVVEADRTIRFIGAFVGSLMTTSEDDQNALGEEDEETARERFFSKLIAHILPGCRAKDKTPRFRCTQLLSEILRNVPSLDDDVYASMREVLLERGIDREWTIRSAACAGLGVLARGEGDNDGESDNEDVETGPELRISVVLQALCQYDPHPHVRMSCLPGLSIPLNASTLPLLLSRTRESDMGVRKMAFRLLQQVPVRGLSVAQRSLLVKNGLGDREASVRAECSKLIYQWAVSCSDYAGEQPSGRNCRRGAAQRLEAKIDLDEFLDLFDLWDGEVAEEALRALVYKRPNVLDGLDLSQTDFWSDFSPSKALLARVFTDLVTISGATTNPFSGNTSNSLGNSTYSFGGTNSAIMSDGSGSITTIPLDLSKHIDFLPVLTLQAFNLQGLFNILVQSVTAIENTENGLPDIPGASKDEIEDQIEDCIYSLGEMLKMTRSLLGGMGGDEMGKRRIKGLIRELLIHPCFPNTLLAQSLSLLLKVSDDKADFIGVIVKPILEDVMQEERRRNRTISRRYTLDARRMAKGSTGDDRELNEEEEDQECDEDTEDIPAEEQIKATYLRLCILNEVLEVVEWPRTSHEMLRQLQRLLVRPALAVYAVGADVPDTTKFLVFDVALKCLGLMAIHAEDLALNALAFGVRGILGAIPSRHTTRVLQCIADIVTSHPKMVGLTFREVVKEAPPELSGVPFLPVLFVKSLQAEDAEIQATTVVGVCKLFLCGIWYNDEIMEALVLLYFLPDTASNNTLRQCLSYFFPAFCYSSGTNQSRFCQVVTRVIIKLCPVYEELRLEAEANDEDAALIQPERVISILLDYADPSNLVEAARFKVDDIEHNHVTLAIDMMEKIVLLVEKTEEGDPALCCIAPMCQGLNRLHFPARMAAPSLRNLIAVVSDVLTNHTPEDKAAFKHLTSFEAKLRKIKSTRKESDDDISDEGAGSKRGKGTKLGVKRKRDMQSESDGGSIMARAVKKRGNTSAQGAKNLDPSKQIASPSRRSEDKSSEQGHPLVKNKKSKHKARLRSAVHDSTSGSGSDTVPRKKRRSFVAVSPELRPDIGSGTRRRK